MDMIKRETDKDINKTRLGGEGDPLGIVQEI